VKNELISFQRALDLTLNRITPLETIVIPVSESLNYIAAEPVAAVVDSPSTNVSTKDGYAVRSMEIAEASPEAPIRLTLLGVTAAGQNQPYTVEPGTAVRILTGAKLPQGADTVVAEEFTALTDKTVSICRQTESGRNILSKGGDVSCGEILIQAGDKLKPGKIGLLAAGGHEYVRAFRKPRVALIATGDEILLPGQPLTEGKLYASNLLTLNAWCRKYGMITELEVIGDDEHLLREKLKQAIDSHDAVITSGGAWTGDRDLMDRVLNDLGWEKVYHRVRLGPGKAVGFGFLSEKPVFILPGGPLSNLVAFLQLSLPGLLKLSGHLEPGLMQLPAKLSEPVEGQSNWTQAIFGFLSEGCSEICFCPSKGMSRLNKMAGAQGLLLVPEGVSKFQAGECVTVQLLR